MKIAVVILWQKDYNLLQNHLRRYNHIFKKIRRIILIAIAFLLLVVIVVNVLILSTFNAKPVKSDVIIVLGCQLWENKPSPMLKFRLEEALKYYNKGFAPKIIVSGAKGADEIMAESQLMKSWLVEKGIPANVIFMDDKSTSTYENLKYSKAIMDAQGFDTAIIVTNDFHIFRSLQIAKALNIKASGAAAPNVSSVRLLYQARETISVLKYFLTGS